MQHAGQDSTQDRSVKRWFRPRDPLVLSACGPASRKRIVKGYFHAFRYARGGLEHLVAISNLRSHKARKAAWSHPLMGDPRTTPARWFGPYSARSLLHLQKVFAAVVFRFTQGYEIGGAVKPTRFLCLGSRHRKCRSNVLANASIYGTVRVCPSLLKRRSDRVGLVVLHEMLHQLGSVRDQRDRVCRRSGETRCYGKGALQLVRHGRLTKALNNNDNLAQFAFFSARAMSSHMREV